MPNLLKLPPRLDEKSRALCTIIETPKGSRNKYNYDDNSGLFQLAMVLPQGMVFPCDFGFIPGTLGEDGDPLDVLLFLDAPAHVGCVIEARLIGVIEVEQKEGKDAFRNDRLLAVSLHSHSHVAVKNIKELDRRLVKEIEKFFLSYNEQHGKGLKILAKRGPSEAVKIVKAGIKTYKKKFK